MTLTPRGLRARSDRRATVVQVDEKRARRRRLIAAGRPASARREQDHPLLLVSLARTERPDRRRRRQLRRHLYSRDERGLLSHRLLQLLHPMRHANLPVPSSITALRNR
jgi:hypothetical protein